MRHKKLKYKLVMENGKPREVILDIDEFERLLEKLEDKYDLETLQEMRQQEPKFSRLEDVLIKANSARTRKNV